MGSQLTKIFGMIFPKKEIRILMVGLDAAGKTSILFKLSRSQAIVIPTIGYITEIIEYKNIKFNIWDVGGKSIFWTQYYQNIDAIIFVVDSTDTCRIQDARNELQKLMNEDQLKDTTLLVFANKQDLPQAMLLPDIIEKLELNGFHNRNWHAQACCANTGEGLQRGLQWLSIIFNKKQKRSDK
ncbi:ADP-ribosylation_factor [Hexamita inflata]|uniref:ADP-ribosylation factor n=1 Tax=Hexamita inflata TaxID=28002 RepID=A0AA86RUH3_9EUKA|nr:ADP-ribosylation factor [Hexamita inflata]